MNRDIQTKRAFDKTKALRKKTTRFRNLRQRLLH